MLAHFEDFILRANKYPTLEISGEQKSQSRKLILVEVCTEFSIVELYYNFLIKPESNLKFPCSATTIMEAILLYMFNKSFLTRKILVKMNCTLLKVQ